LKPSWTGLARRRREPRLVTAEPLSVAPALIGRALATPGRRAAALGIDLALLALIANLGRWGLAAALLLLAWHVALSLAAEGARPLLARGVAAVLVLGALLLVWAELRPPSEADWEREARRAERRAEALLEPPAQAAAAAEDASEAVERAVRDGGGGDAAARQAAEAVAAALRVATRAGAEGPSASAAASAPVTREAELEAALAELRRLRQAHRPPRWADHLDANVRELVQGFGWGIVYFSLLPAFWQGRTLGKALLGLRIAELGGRRLTPLRALKRYGGYAAGLATGGLGFAQMLWDPNRQALHDKAAHTVVLDDRPALRHPAAAGSDEAARAMGTALPGGPADPAAPTLAAETAPPDRPSEAHGPVVVPPPPPPH
jgi:hypothetical protein